MKHFDVRPIGARALKSARDTLRPHMCGARVADLFAGQGRFGLAALTEGASYVVFVEQERSLCNSIGKSASKHKDAVQIHCMKVLKFLSMPQTMCFDIIFADPPFVIWNEIIHIIELFTAVRAHLEVGGIFLVKKPTRVLAFAPSDNLVLDKQTTIGESTLVYYHAN